jgi:hypothetical protein
MNLVGLSERALAARQDAPPATAPSPETQPPQPPAPDSPAPERIESAPAAEPQSQPAEPLHGPPQLPAIDAPLPDANAVLQRHLEVSGGEAALRLHSSLSMKGRCDIPGQGLTVEISLLAAAPNKLRVATALPGLGPATLGFDGEAAWTEHPPQPPALLEGDLHRQLREDADFYGNLALCGGVNARAKYASIEMVGRIIFESTDCYQLKLVSPSGRVTMAYFDIASGLLHATSGEIVTGSALLPTVIINDAFAVHGGITLPVRQTIKQSGMTQQIVYDTVEFDAVDAAAFEAPADIRAMVLARDNPAPEPPPEAAPSDPAPASQPESAAAGG